MLDQVIQMSLLLVYCFFNIVILFNDMTNFIHDGFTHRNSDVVTLTAINSNLNIAGKICLSILTVILFPLASLVIWTHCLGSFLFTINRR